MGETDKTSSSYCAGLYMPRWKMPRGLRHTEQGHLTQPGEEVLGAEQYLAVYVFLELNRGDV